MKIKKEKELLSVVYGFMLKNTKIILKEGNVG